MKVKRGIAFRINLVIAAIIVVIGLVLCSLSFHYVRQQSIERENVWLQNIVRMVSFQADGDKIRQYYETGQKDAYYEELSISLHNIVNNTDDMGYLYIFVPEKDHWTYIVEAANSMYAQYGLDELGDTYEYTEAEYEHLIPDIKAQRASEGIMVGSFYTEANVVPISAWAPIFDSKGQFVGMVEGDMAISQLYSQMRSYLIVFLSIIVLCLVIILISLLGLMNLFVTRPINYLTKYVESYDGEQFKIAQFEYKRKDEIKELADSFEDMDERIKKYVSELTQITAEKERIGAELSLASEIQLSMLPKIFPAFPERDEFSLWASMVPAKEVGGDFYDFYMIDDDHLVLTIADVSGKGVPAALFMMISMLLLKNAASITLSPKEIFERSNHRICENNEQDMFVTVWLGILEISSGIITAASAGHEYPAIKRAGGDFEIYKDRHSMPLGAMDGLRFREYEIQLNPGDSLFVYTDGVVEATDADKNLFGIDHMIEALNINENGEVEQLIQTVTDSIQAFVKEEPQFDDTTMLALNYYGKENKDKNAL